MSGMSDMSSTSSNSTMSMKMYMHGSIGSDMVWFDSWMPTSQGAFAGACIGLFLLALLDRYLAALRRACDVYWNRGQLGFQNPASSGALALPSSSSSSSSSLPLPNTVRRSSTLKPDLLSTSLDQACACEEGSSSSSAPAPGYTTVDTQEKNVSSSPPTVSHLHLPRAARRNLDPARALRWSRPFRWGVDVPRGFLHALQTLVHYLLMLVVMTFQIWWIVCVVLGAGIGEALFGRFGPRL